MTKGFKRWLGSIKGYFGLMFASSDMDNHGIEEEEKPKVPREVEKMVVVFPVSERVFTRTVHPSFVDYEPVVFPDGTVVNFYSSFPEERKSMDSGAILDGSFFRKDYLKFEATDLSQAFTLLLSQLDKINFSPLVMRVRKLIDAIRCDLSELESIFIEAGIDERGGFPAEKHRGIQESLGFFGTMFKEVEKFIFSPSFNNREILDFSEKNSDLIDRLEKVFPVLMDDLEDSRGKDLPRKFQKEAKGVSRSLNGDFWKLISEIKGWKVFTQNSVNGGAFGIDPDRDCFFLPSCPYLFRGEFGYICGEVSLDRKEFFSHGDCFIDNKDVPEYPHCSYDRKNWGRVFLEIDQDCMMIFFYPEKKAVEKAVELLLDKTNC